MAHSFVALRWERMALETVPKDLRHLRACLLCSLVKVSVGDLVVRAQRETKLGERGWNRSAGTKRKSDPGLGAVAECGKEQEAIVYFSRDTARL